MRMEDYYIAKYNRLNREKMSAINSNHIFADNTARDTYFTTNPTEKVASLIISVGVGYQEWNGSDWIDKTGLVGAGDAVYISVQDAGNQFTGTDVEAVLQEIGTKKIDKTQIVNDLTTGGITNVASAETVKTLGTQINNLDAEKATKVELNNSLALKADKTLVDSNYATLDTKINSQVSGSPKATYATVSALTTAFPTGNTNIYVVAADGKWYYWNGTAWTAGGVYQSTGIADKAVKRTNIDDDTTYSIDKIDGQLLRTDQIAVSPYTDFTLDSDNNLYLTKKVGVTYLFTALFFPSEKKEITFKHIRDTDYICLGGNDEYFTLLGIGTYNIRLIDMTSAGANAVVDVVKTPIAVIGDYINYKWVGNILYAKRSTDNGVTWNDWFNLDMSAYANIVYWKTRGTTRFGTTNTSSVGMKTLCISDVSFAPLNTYNIEKNLKIVKKYVDSQVFSETYSNVLSNLVKVDGRINSTTGALVDGSAFKNIKLAVNQGDVISFHSCIVGNTQVYGYAFYDASDVYISGQAILTEEDLFVTVPINAKYWRYGMFADKWNESIYSTFIVIIASKTKSIDAVIGKQIKTLSDKVYYNNLSALTWNPVGDSITYRNQYQPIVEKALAIVSKGNYGVSSCTMAINNTYLTAQSVVERVCGLNGNTAITDADIWTIYAGVNDWEYKTPLGDITSTDITTFYGALKAICENILNRANKPKLILFTPLQSSRNGKNNATPSLVMLDYVNAIIEVGQYYSIPVLDLYTIGGINPINLSYYTEDGVHPNLNYGMPLLASKIIKCLKNL